MDLHRPEKRRTITPPPPAAGVTLPEDLLLMEVLARLPVKFIVRSKCVCRSWRARVEDAAFVCRHRHFSRASPPSILVVMTSNKGEEDGEIPDNITFYRLRPGQKPGDFEANKAELLLEKAACPPEAGGVTDVIHATHCDGLVAVTTTTNQVYVCNPTTRELVALPLGSGDVDLNNKKHPSAVIGFDSLRNHYVVARYFYRRWSYDESSCKLDYDIGHEVFILGGDSWELTADPPHAIGGTPPVCTGDAFYWACEAAEEPQPSSLLRFSLRDRMFSQVPCPPEFGYDPAMDHLADLDGKLCHVNNCASLTTFNVWQLGSVDDTRPVQWSLRCRIDPGEISFGSDGFLPLWAAGGGMLVRVSDTGEKLYWCDEKSQDVQKVLDLEDVGLEDVDSEHWYPVYHVVPYIESLVSIRKCKV
jgi:F-box interacting protein